MVHLILQTEDYGRYTTSVWCFIYRHLVVQCYTEQGQGPGLLTLGASPTRMRPTV
jgi:hypothetical protein